MPVPWPLVAHGEISALMNASRFVPQLLSLAGGCLLFLSVGCRDRTKPVINQGEPSRQPPGFASVSVDPERATPAVRPPAATAPAIPPSASLGDIAGYAYERRNDFIAGLTRLAGNFDVQVQQLNARRATLPQTSVTDWDVAMKELTSARSDLQFKITQLGSATAESWSQVRDGAAEAWTRVQAAYDNVSRSTTQ